MSSAKKKYRDWTPEQKEKHRLRTLRWRELNRDKFLALGAASQRRARARNPDREKEYKRRFSEKNPDYWRQWQAANRDSARAAAARWAKKNVGRVREYRKARNLKELYGLSIERFNQMLADQFGRCAICTEALGEGKSRHVDHCHATGAVRAILCNGCNNMLGRSGDSPELLRRGAEYLEKWRTVSI